MERWYRAIVWYACILLLCGSGMQSSLTLCLEAGGITHLEAAPPLGGCATRRDDPACSRPADRSPSCSDVALDSWTVEADADADVFPLASPGLVTRAPNALVGRRLARNCRSTDAPHLRWLRTVVLLA